MRKRRRTATHSAVAALFVLLAGPGLSTSLEAQTASPRAHLGWVAGEVGGVMLGFETRVPLGDLPPLPLPGRPGSGPVEAPTRRWTLTGMFTAGANVAPGGDADVRPLAYGHAGVLYRTGSSVPNAVGGAVAVYLPVGLVGPVAMIEATDLITAQAGVLWGNGGWRGHAGLGVSVRFLRDIF